MRTRIVAVMAVAVLVLAFAACQKESAKEASTASPHGAGGPGSSIVMSPGETQVIVPEFLKGKYTTVVLVVTDKATNKDTEAKVAIGGEYKIPGSDVTVKVGDFLPDFKMDGTIITSTTDAMNNPAVRITVTDGKNEVFKGWLYSKFPAIHPFQHEKFGLSLKDAVKKG